MKKECILLDGKVINIGPWDYQMQAEIATNPLPKGAEVVELEVDQKEDGGWYAVEYAAPATDSLEAAVAELKSLKKRTDDVEASIYALFDMV